MYVVECLGTFNFLKKRVFPSFLLLSYILVPSGRRYKGKFRKSKGFGVRQILFQVLARPFISYLTLANYFTLLTSKYLFGTYHVLGTVLPADDTETNKKDIVPTL